MNIRMYSIALLISALPQFAFAGSAISLNKEDFVAAEKVSPSGETVVKVKLSKSGKAKFKKLNQQKVASDVHIDVGGVTLEFTLKQPIAGDGLEMGPYGAEDADRVVAEINK